VNTLADGIEQITRDRLNNDNVEADIDQNGDAQEVDIHVGVQGSTAAKTAA